MTPLQARARLKIWLVVLGIFALGGATGAALDRVLCLRDRAAHHAGRHKGRGDRFLQAMQRELALSEDQTAQVRAIIQEAREQYWALQQEVRPRYDAVRQRERERIRALLLPEQQQRFDEMIRRHQTKHEKHNEKNR